MLTRLWLEEERNFPPFIDIVSPENLQILFLERHLNHSSYFVLPSKSEVIFNERLRMLTCSQKDGKINGWENLSLKKSDSDSSPCHRMQFVIFHKVHIENLSPSPHRQ